MGYFKLPDKARKSPLGFAGLNGLVSNLSDTVRHFNEEHNADGTHNSLEVARVCGTVVWTAGAPGAYTLSGFNSYASLAVGHNPATGRLILTLDSARVSAPMVVACTAQDNQGEGKPLMVTPKATIGVSTVEFHLKELTSALGGSNNNTWAARDMTFAVRISSNKHAHSGTPFDMPTLITPGSFLGDEANERLNGLIRQTGKLRKSFLVGHTTAGIHAIREMAKHWAYASYSGGSYSLDAGNVSSVSSGSAGQVEINFASSTTPYQVFVALDYTRRAGGSANEFYVVTAPVTHMSATKVRLYFYRYDFSAKSWGRADTDFFVSIHTTP